MRLLAFLVAAAAASPPLTAATPTRGPVELPTPWPGHQSVSYDPETRTTIVAARGADPTTNSVGGARTLPRWAAALETNDAAVVATAKSSVERAFQVYKEGILQPGSRGAGAQVSDEELADAVRLEVERAAGDLGAGVRFADGSPDAGLTRWYEFIPVHVANALPGGSTAVPVPGSPCFSSVAIKSVSVTGAAATVVVETGGKIHGAGLLCRDHLLLAAVGSIHALDLSRPNATETVVLSNLSPDSIADLFSNGVRAFRFRDGALGTIADAWETLLLFLADVLPFDPHVPDWVARENLDFLRERMDIDMPERKVRKVHLDPSEIHSGDFLGIIRLDGLDPMVAFGMGSHTGHTVTALWIDGELYVVESQVKSNYWPVNFIQKNRYEDWLRYAEDADYNVIHLPLSPEARAQFNETAAVEHFRAVEGIRYGYGNFLWGWLDRGNGNMPPPLSVEIVTVAMSIADALKPALVDIIWNAGLNKRLNTTALSTAGVYRAADARGISLSELVSIPEQDSWRYDDHNGHPRAVSYVCNVFVCSMYKAAGLFGSLADEIQCTESTNRDIYSLKIFDTNYTRPQQCVDADPDSQFCQLLGKYRMALPSDQYSSHPPYAHSWERCGGLPPRYDRPWNC